MDEPPPESRASQTVVDEGNLSSKRERSHFSQELDIKPGGKREIQKTFMSVCMCTQITFVMWL